jgi:hypothetical protein
MTCVALGACGGKSRHPEPMNAPPETAADQIVSHWCEWETDCQKLVECNFISGTVDECARYEYSPDTVREVLARFSDAEIERCGPAVHAFETCFRALPCEELGSFYAWDDATCDGSPCCAADKSICRGQYPCADEAFDDNAECAAIDAALEALRP